MCSSSSIRRSTVHDHEHHDTTGIPRSSRVVHLAMWLWLTTNLTVPSDTSMTTNQKGVMAFVLPPSDPSRVVAATSSWLRAVRINDELLYQPATTIDSIQLNTKRMGNNIHRHSLSKSTTAATPPSKQNFLSHAVASHGMAYGISGIDRDHGTEYWFDPRIHSLGNTGFLGGLHAATATFSTKMIDIAAYGGIDLRNQVG
jgi:hypothetical protein